MRIKKVYFDAIKKGTKKTEYRAMKQYYGWLFGIETPFMLKLHYQKKGVFLLKKVKRVTQEYRDYVTKECPTRTVWVLHF